MKLPRMLSAVILTCIAPVSVADDLDDVLDRLKRVAHVYADNALTFTAEETTRVFTTLGPRGAPRRMNLVNLYSYERDENGILRDKRVRKSEVKRLRKATSFEEITRLTESLPDPMTEHQGMHGSQSVPAFLDRPYSWILLLSESSREAYDYGFEDSDEPGRLVIHLQPKPGTGEDFDWRGKAIVDRDTWQIVRAGGMQLPDFREYERMQAMLKSADELPLDVDERTFVVRSVTTYFDVIHRGLRFPSKVEIKILLHRLSGPADDKRLTTTIASTIEQTYERYRFYDVGVTTDLVPQE